MRLIRAPLEVFRLGRGWRRRGIDAAFVPTMGGLHEGHLALMRRARRLAPRVVVSVFVNPLQFGPGEDLARYPRSAARDRRLAAAAGVDVFYAPSVPDVYPPDHETRIEVPRLASQLCGAYRPGHFTGVVTVVLKLLHQVGPRYLVMGQKDAQQALVIRRMLRDLDLERWVALRVYPTVRERDGLAMSSRNRYLTPAERRQAPVLYRALRAAVERIAAGERRTAVLARRIHAVLRQAPLVRPQYVRLVDTVHLLQHDRIPREVLIAVAAHLGRARLIDNVIVRLDRHHGA
jgi:pantoate--beta-alanine ligase